MKFGDPRLFLVFLLVLLAGIVVGWFTQLDKKSLKTGRNQAQKKVAMRMTTSLNARKRAFWTLLPCDADRTQTCNLLIRSQMLYSIKLRRLSFIASANVG